MGYLGRRIGLSQDNGDSNPGAAGGAVGGGLLDLIAHGYFERQGDIYNAPNTLPSGLAATGGVISDYTTGPGDVYRAHVFTSSGALNVTALSNDPSLPDTIDYLVIGGGGGGAAYQGGGGGAGGFRTNVPGTPHSTSTAFTAAVAAYPIIIGAGGNGGTYVSPSINSPGSDGADTSFGPPSSPARIISSGGGAGVGYPVSGTGHPAGNAGGSGGGAGRGGTPYVATGNGGATESITGLPVSPTTQGHAGGTGGSNGNPIGNSNHSYGGGGGGGAGAVGGNATLPNAGPASVGGAGGAGLQLAIAGPAANTTGVGALNPGPGQYQWFAGGGSGSSGKQGNANGTVVSGGVGGGGVGGQASGVTPAALHNATISTGSGGGGAASPSTPIAGSGGSGIVVVRYQIGSVTATAKATGGAISYYGGKTIHAFTGSGTFVTESNWDAGTNEVQYVVVAGGGAGGNNLSGGGGAGGFLAGTTTINHPSPVSIQVGAGGAVRTTPIAYGDRASLYGNSGTPSYFGTPITAYGGGGGGAVDSNNAQPGGSGGGSGGGSSGGPSGAPGNKQTGTSTAAPGQGNDGGDTPRAGSYGGGGGGGAGGAGTSNSDGGVGGVGSPVPATFQNPVSILNAHDPSPYKFTIAAGGGGGKNGGGDGGVGGYGGGGDAGNASSTPTSPGDNAIQSTGSGGGGAGHSPQPGFGGAGGSGIVLIAYPS